MKIAVIGGGAAGITAAFLLDKTHDVTLFEKRPILGGNVRTLNKNVTNVNLAPDLKIDNGVIEFQHKHFVNFHKLMDRLGVATETIDGGATSLYLNNGKVVYSPGVAAHLSRWQQVRNYGRLLPMAIASRRFLQQANEPDAGKNRPTSDYVDNSVWGRWQKMLLMYGYSIPYKQIDDFPAEVAFSILRDTEPGTRWTRVVDGVYTYFEKILDCLRGTVHTGVTITAVQRNADGVQIRLATGDTLTFDKVVFATPPDQVLKLLADPSAAERKRFGAWQANKATTEIHTDMGFYRRFKSNYYTEFDVFEKPQGDAGYNAFLNRLCGLPESAPHYNLAFNLTEWIDPHQIIHTQQHHTPLYTVDAMRYRDEVMATNGENHTFHAGAYLGNGLHEGAISSGLAVSRLLGGERL